MIGLSEEDSTDPFDDFFLVRDFAILGAIDEIGSFMIEITYNKL